MAKAPRVENILEIKGTLPANTLIHFKASQWKDSLARAKGAAGTAAWPSLRIRVVG